MRKILRIILIMMTLCLITGCSEKTKISFNINNVVIDVVINCGEAAFYQCYSLKEVNLPSGLVEIGMMAFAACIELRNVKISSNIKVISAAVFAECYKLSAVERPGCLEKIEYSAFQNCYSLESIVIPIGVKEIGMIAFYGCENIKVYCEASSPLEGWANNWNVVDSKTGKTIEAFWGYKK